MMRARFWAAALSASLLLGCNFDARMASYCQETGKCACDQGECCFSAGTACEEGDCCDGLTCSGGKCVSLQGDLVLSLSVSGAAAKRFDLSTPGSDQVRDLLIHNRGIGPSAPIAFSLEGDVSQFSVFGGTCAGQSLAPAAECTAQVLFSPTASGQFSVTLHVRAGDSDTTLGFKGATEALVNVEITTAGAAARVVSNVPAIDCQNHCSAVLAAGTYVFTETHDAGTTFQNWSGCEADGGTCTLKMLDDPGAFAFNVAARFRPWLGSLQVTGGWIDSDPPGLDCGDQHRLCSAALAGPVRLFAHPADGGSSLTAWSGACADAGANPECDLNLTEPVTVGASFGSP